LNRLIPQVARFFLKADLRRGWLQRIFVLLSIALGVTALVALEAFAKRIGASVSKDTRSFLSADFQIRAFREFDPEVRQAAEKLSIKAPGAAGQGVIEQTDIITTVFLWEREPVAVTLRALEGAYPFYGTFKNDQNLKIEDLRAEPAAIVEASFRERGLKVGDKVRVGELSVRVAAFLEEEPQTSATFFGVGPKIIVHRAWLEKTGLLIKTSRALRLLLVRSNLTTKKFQEEFRKLVPDPHWRIVTPERANMQVQNVVGRLSSFLSLVALAALFLGALGVFMMLRSHFLLKREQWLSLRCMGLSRRALSSLVVIQSMILALIGGSLGSLFAVVVERLVSQWAQKLYGVELAEISVWPSFVYGLGVAALTVLFSLWSPLQEMLRWPVAHAFQDTSNEGGVRRRDLLPALIFAFLLVAWVAGSLKIGTYFFGGLAASALLLIFMGETLIGLLKIPLKFFQGIERHIFLRLIRQAAQFRLLMVSVGLGVFLVALISILSDTLRHQIDLSKKQDLPNFYVMSVDEASLPGIQEILPNGNLAPITQARIKSVKGESLKEQETEDGESDDRARLQSREYTITKRAALSAGERLVKGESIFGPPNPDYVRVSIEDRFADRVGLDVGDRFQISIAGVDLTAQVESRRTVDWWNFRPNFFLVFHEADLVGAPMDYVVFSRRDPAEIPSLQKVIARSFPHTSSINGEVISQRLTTLIRRMTQALYSVGLFTILAAFFVFLGLVLSRRGQIQQEIFLLRCLGWNRAALRKLFTGEFSLACLFSSWLAFALAIVSSWMLCRFLLDIEFRFPGPMMSLGFLFVPLLFFALTSLLLIEPMVKRAPADLFRGAGET
jgi:putative ABC transport system permease protein